MTSTRASDSSNSHNPAVGVQGISFVTVDVRGHFNDQGSEPGSENLRVQATRRASASADFTTDDDSSTGVLYSDATANHPTRFPHNGPGSLYTFSGTPPCGGWILGNQAYRDKWIANVKRTWRSVGSTAYIG